MVSSVSGGLSWLRRPLRLTGDEALAHRLSLAGYRQPEDVDTFLNFKVLCPVLGVLAATFTGRDNVLVFSFVLGALGYFAPDLILIQLTSRRKTQISLALPNALDLLVVCMDAGLGMDQAVLRVGKELEMASPALSEELVILSREQRAGKPRVEAWRSFADRVDLDSVRQFASMLTQSERLGTPIARALADFSDTLRMQRLHQAEERAAKTTIKLIFPLVIFIFPAMFVVILGPAGLALIKVFDEMAR
jgi:tight adherence protein C